MATNKGVKLGFGNALSFTTRVEQVAYNAYGEVHRLVPAQLVVLAVAA